MHPPTTVAVNITTPKVLPASIAGSLNALEEMIP
jgi:hypothetical protein